VEVDDSPSCAYLMKTHIWMVCRPCDQAITGSAHFLCVALFLSSDGNVHAGANQDRQPRLPPKDVALRHLYSACHSSAEELSFTVQTCRCSTVEHAGSLQQSQIVSLVIQDRRHSPLNRPLQYTLQVPTDSIVVDEELIHFVCIHRNVLSHTNFRGPGPES
jgi:hypothetical protein